VTPNPLSEVIGSGKRRTPRRGPAEGHRLLANLQGLRALAALGVVVFHFGLMPATRIPFTIGAAGVDVFFVLSGFIIAHSSSRSARHFLAHRLIRVVPAYWIATAFAAVFTLQNLDMSEAGGWLLQSLFYLPHPDGRPPLIFVAWTLVYELAFYLVYWLALRVGPRAAPALCIALLLLLALFHVPGLAGPWPLLLEFVMGISIYLAVERYGLLRLMPGWAGLLVAGVGLALLMILPPMTVYNPDDYQGVGRVLSSGVPAAVIVLGLVVAEHGRIALQSKFILVLGAASYAIYLLHPIAVGQLLQLPPGSPPISWALGSVAVGITVGAAVAYNIFLEMPLLRRLRGLLRDPLPIEQRVSGL
jgi:exopolysaccharide production protein ExoZ